MAGPSRPPFSQLSPPRAPQPSYTGWNPDPTFSPDFNQHMVQQYEPYHANTPPVQLLSLASNQLLSWGTLIVPPG